MKAVVPAVVAATQVQAAHTAYAPPVKVDMPMFLATAALNLATISAVTGTYDSVPKSCDALCNACLVNYARHDCYYCLNLFCHDCFRFSTCYRSPTYRHVERPMPDPRYRPAESQSNNTTGGWLQDNNSRGQTTGNYSCGQSTQNYSRGQTTEYSSDSDADDEADLNTTTTTTDYCSDPDSKQPDDKLPKLLRLTRADSKPNPNPIIFSPSCKRSRPYSYKNGHSRPWRKRGRKIELLSKSVQAEMDIEARFKALKWHEQSWNVKVKAREFFILPGKQMKARDKRNPTPPVEGSHPTATVKQAEDGGKEVGPPPLVESSSSETEQPSDSDLETDSESDLSDLEQLGIELSRGQQARSIANPLRRAIESNARFTVRSQSKSAINGDETNHDKTNKNLSILDISDGREYCIDSGSSYHCIDLNTLSAEERALMRRLPTPITMQTGSGRVKAKYTAMCKILNLNSMVKCCVIPNCPAVLSLGRLCRRNGFSFYWPAGRHSLPVIIHEEDGIRVECDIENDTPTLIPKKDASRKRIDPEDRSKDVYSGNSETRDRDLDWIDEENGTDTKADPLAYDPLPEPYDPELDWVDEATAFANALKESEKCDECGDGEITLPLPGISNATSEEAHNSGQTAEEPEEKGDSEDDSEKPIKQKAKKKKLESLICQPCAPPPEHFYNNFPKHPGCPVCIAVKTKNSQHRKRNAKAPEGGADVPKAEKFGELITADHGDAGRKGQTVSLVVQDRHGVWLQQFASKTKSTKDTKMGLQRFMGPKAQPQHVYTDGSKEFHKAFDELEWPADVSKPYIPQSNGVAERAVNRMTEGASCALEQSGLETEWWPEAADCFCFLFNIHEAMADGFTPYESRFLRKFKGPKIPFGAEVDYKPTRPNDIARLSKFGKKMLTGIMIGYT